MKCRALSTFSTNAIHADSFSELRKLKFSIHSLQFSAVRRLQPIQLNRLPHPHLPRQSRGVLSNNRICANFSLLDSFGPFNDYFQLLIRLAASLTIFMAVFRRTVNRLPANCDIHVTQEESLVRVVVDTLTDLRKAYRPFFPFTNGHFDTIFAAFYRRSPIIKYKRECIHLTDGGVVALDSPIDEHKPGMTPTNPPVLILLPGLTGGSEDTYIRSAVQSFRSIGWKAIVFNSRGCAHSPVTTPQFYSASHTEDLRCVIADVARKFPESSLYAVGWSLGANILVRYLGQEGEKTVLKGAMSLCNPFDLVLSDKNFHIGFNNVYDRNLAKALKNIFKRHEMLFADMPEEFNIDLVSTAKTVRDFDEGLTRVSFGYETVDEYYADASSSKSIKDVKIPLLCIQARDDPIAPIEGTPVKEIEDNPNCALVVTPQGGHLGWIAGKEAPFGAPWTNSVSLDFFVNLNERINAPDALEGAVNSNGAVSGVSA